MKITSIHNLGREFLVLRHFGMYVSSRMCIKDVSSLSFRHSAIRFSKYGTFRHANKQPRLYNPYNIQKKVEKKIVKHFVRQKRGRTFVIYYFVFLPQ